MVIERKLSFKDTFVSKLVEVVSDRFDTMTDFDTLPFTDTTTRINLTFNMNNSEYTKVLSALMNGADLTFPDEAHELTLILCQLIEGGTMSCEDVADCIDNDATVQAALLNQLSANGYSPNNNSVSTTNITMTPSQRAENLLPATYSCDDAHLMATARSVVREFHEATVDFFQSIELETNAVELGVILTDGVPVAGSLNNIAEFLDWAVGTLQETYEASYTQEVEDSLSCALYCLMQPDCELTYDMLIAMYEDFIVVDYSLPSSDTDFQELADWAIGLALEVGAGVVASFHYLLAQAMKFGDGTVFTMAGLTDLKGIIGMTASLLDNTFADCDCAPDETPTDYWMIYQDLSFGIGEFFLDFGTQVDNGMMSAAFGAQARLNVEINDLGATFPIVAAATSEQRRGSIGNGTNDFRRIANFPNVNQGGTESVMLAEGFITCNTNSCGNGVILGAPQNGRSLRWSYGVDGAQSYPTNFVTALKLVVYGNCNTGQVKPAAAVYVDSIPATVGELFP